MKSLQLSRTVCTSLSLGAADHALGLTLRFVTERKLYERRLFDLPLVRQAIGEATAMLLMVEAVSLVASRCITALPGEMSVVAALVKAFVPSTVDQLIAMLGDVLGARAFLSEVFEHGMFQKVERDHRIVAIFDGSTVVNRNGLINQFHTLARAYKKQICDCDGLVVALDVDADLPEFTPEKLRLISDGGCSILQNLQRASDDLHNMDADYKPSVAILQLTDVLSAATREVMEECAVYQAFSRDVPPAAFELAQRYELCFAGATCIGFWLSNYGRFCSASLCSPLWRDAIWLEATLTHIVSRLAPSRADKDSEIEIYNVLADCAAKNRSGKVSLLFVDDEGEN